MHMKLMLVGALVASLQMFMTTGDEVTVDAASPTEDAYAAYQQYYQQYSNNIQQAHPQQHGKPQSAFQVLKNKQDSFASDLTNIMGEDALVTLALIGAVTGVVSMIGLAVNANSISDLSKDQDSICTTTKALGNTALTSTTYANLGSTGTYSATVAGQIVAQLNLIETKLNGYATPDC